MNTIDLREGAKTSLSFMKKGDKLIIENGEAFIILSNGLKYDEYSDTYYFEARTEQRIYEDFCGYEFIFINTDGTLGQIDDVCMWNEMTGAI